MSGPFLFMLKYWLKRKGLLHSAKAPYYLIVLIINVLLEYRAKKYGSVNGAVCLYKFHVMKN